jgi:hypothetical protein
MLDKLKKGMSWDGTVWTAAPVDASGGGELNLDSVELPPSFAKFPGRFSKLQGILNDLLNDQVAENKAKKAVEEYRSHTEQKGAAAMFQSSRFSL